MPVYRRGSVGPEVARVQEELRRRGHYLGAADGAFGGGTESAVKAFQRAAGLTPDGAVGDGTWRALFGRQPIPAPAVAARPLDLRCLALTGSFETGAGVPECFCGVSGDFDGQGMSFGALQWNLGQGTLQTLLLDLERRNAAVIDDVFHDHADELRAMLRSPRREQLAWARSIQDVNRRRLAEPWRGLFKTLGRRQECQAAQSAAAAELYRNAIALCRSYGLRSERAVALMFDILVQNGSISPLVRAQIEREFTRIAATDRDAAEVERLRIIANRRAEAAKPQWVEDVRQRKLAIANGAGTVHGRHYDLAEDFGITLRPFEPVVRAPAETPGSVVARASRPRRGVRR